MNTVKPVAGEAKVNAGAAREPKSSHAKPAGGQKSPVGNETKADMAGTGLSGAVAELRSQHPIAHYDHGPHLGTDHHRRHEALHGMKSRG